MEVLPLQRIPEIGGVGAAVQIDEAVLRHPQLARLGQAGDQHGGRLVHVHDGVEVLGVGEAHHAVALGDRDELLRRARDREPGQRIVARHVGEWREQLPHPALVFRNRTAVAGPQRVLEQRIGVDGTPKPVAGFIGRHAGPRIADPLRRRQRLVLGPVVEPEPLGEPLGRRAQELAPHGHGELRLALGDPFAQGVDQLLRAVAAHVGIDAPARLRAERRRQAGRRIGAVRRRPSPTRRIDREAHHRQTVEPAQGVRRQSGVDGGANRRNLQQFCRRRRILRFAAIGELARPDENWRPLVHLAPPWSPWRRRS